MAAIRRERGMAMRLRYQGLLRNQAMVMKAAPSTKGEVTGFDADG